MAANSAISILIVEMTGSSTALTVSVLLGILPNGIVSFLGGYLADRFPARNLLLGSFIFFALEAGVLCALYAKGSLQVQHIYALDALSSAVGGISDPAMAKFTAQLAGKQQLKNALALKAVCWNIAWVGVPPLAGIIIGLWGVFWLFLGNAISYVRVIVLLLRLKPNGYGPPAASAEAL